MTEDIQNFVKRKLKEICHYKDLDVDESRTSK
jgi:hypothetical protein